MIPKEKKVFYELLNGLREDRLTPAQFEQLDRLLKENEAARVEYVRFMHLCLDLKDFEEAGILAGASRGGFEAAEPVSFGAAVDMDLWRALSQEERTSPPIRLQEPAEEAVPVFPVKKPAQSVFSAANTRRSLLTLAGSIAALAAMLLYVHLKTPNAAPYVATLTRTVDDAKWLNVTGSLNENGDLCAGPLHLSRGCAEIVTDNGTRVILQGPVQLELESPSQLLLKQGRVTVHIAGDPDTHFVVRTPAACIVDFGTEFGVSVDAFDRILTYVFQGEVELRSGSNPLRLDRVLKLTAGSGGQADTAGNIAPYAPAAGPDAVMPTFVRSDEFDLRYKASKGSAYHRWKAYSYHLRQDPSLVAYYTFERDASQPALLLNEADATQGKMNGLLTGLEGRSRPTWDQGRWPEKTALAFDRDLDQFVTVAAASELCLNGPVTLAAWIYLGDPKEGGHILSSRLEDSTINYQLGFRSPSSAFWDSHIQLARKTSTQTVGDFVHSRPISEQQGWLLIAASHDNQTLKYYLNGQLVDSANWAFRQDAVEAGLMIGTTYLHEDDDSQFDGKIGEIAVFKRILSDEEILNMYQAGRP